MISQLTNKARASGFKSTLRSNLMKKSIEKKEPKGEEKREAKFPKAFQKKGEAAEAKGKPFPFPKKVKK